MTSKPPTSPPSSFNDVSSTSHTSTQSQSLEPPRAKKRLNNSASLSSHSGNRSPKLDVSIKEFLPVMDPSLSRYDNSKLDPDEGTIRCLCERKQDEGVMYQCESCFGWLHAHCVPLLIPGNDPLGNIHQPCVPMTAPIILRHLERSTKSKRVRPVKGHIPSNYPSYLWFDHNGFFVAYNANEATEPETFLCPKCAFELCGSPNLDPSPTQKVFICPSCKKWSHPRSLQRLCALLSHFEKNPNSRQELEQKSQVVKKMLISKQYHELPASTVNYSKLIYDKSHPSFESRHCFQCQNVPDWIFHIYLIDYHCRKYHHMLKNKKILLQQQTKVDMARKSFYSRLEAQRQELEAKKNRSKRSANGTNKSTTPETNAPFPNWGAQRGHRLTREEKKLQQDLRRIAEMEAKERNSGTISTAPLSIKPTAQDTSPILTASTNITPPTIIERASRSKSSTPKKGVRYASPTDIAKRISLGRSRMMEETIEEELKHRERLETDSVELPWSILDPEIQSSLESELDLSRVPSVHEKAAVAPEVIKEEPLETSSGLHLPFKSLIKKTRNPNGTATFANGNESGHSLDQTSHFNRPHSETSSSPQKDDSFQSQMWGKKALILSSTSNSTQNSPKTSPTPHFGGSSGISPPMSQSPERDQGEIIAGPIIATPESPYSIKSPSSTGSSPHHHPPTLRSSHRNRPPSRVHSRRPRPRYRMGFRRPLGPRRPRSPSRGHHSPPPRNSPSIHPHGMIPNRHPPRYSNPDDHRSLSHRAPGSRGIRRPMASRGSAHRPSHRRSPVRRFHPRSSPRSQPSRPYHPNRRRAYPQPRYPSRY